MKKYLFISEWDRVYSRQKYIIDALKNEGLDIDILILDKLKWPFWKNYVYNISFNKLLLKRFLEHKNIGSYEGIILTYDFTYTMQRITEIVNDLWIPSFLVFHEGVFFDIKKWHRLDNTSVNRMILGSKYLTGIPCCKHIFPWWDIHKKELLRRWYQENILMHWTNKFAQYSDLTFDDTQIRNKIWINNTKPVLTYVCQLFDIQIDEKAGIAAQLQAIYDLIDYARKNNYNLVLRSVVGLELPDFKYENLHIDGMNWEYATSAKENILISQNVYGFNSTILIEALIAWKSAYSFKYIDYHSDFANEEYMNIVQSSEDLYKRKSTKNWKKQLWFLIWSSTQWDIMWICKYILQTPRTTPNDTSYWRTSIINPMFLLLFIKDLVTYLQSKLWKK